MSRALKVWMMGSGLWVALLLGSSFSYGEEDKIESKGKPSESELSSKAKQEFELPDGLKWETNNEDPIFADPRAQKGGVYKGALSDFPATFRQVGPNSNSGFRGLLDDYDLYPIEVHPNTAKFIPSLATHWAVAPDYKTVYYKLDLRARWSDGKPVIAEDYLFTLEFMRSPHIVAPWYNNYYTEEIAEIRKHSESVISVVSAKPHIKFTLLLVTRIKPTPRHFYKLDKNWVKNYNWKVKPNTGAYEIKRFKHGKFVDFERKKDWWAKDSKYNEYRYNPDVMQYKVIRDEEAQWQHFFKGDLTVRGATIPSWWHDKAQGEVFDKGYVKKLWFYYQLPQGTSIIWLNESKDPWKDANVRYAFAHSLNFKKVLDEILRGDYGRQQAFYEGYGGYDNPDIQARSYDVTKAAEYMNKSGWSMGKSGFWEKDGQPLKVTLSYGYSYHTERLVILKEEAKKAGFDIELDLLDSTAAYKKQQEKNYEVAWTGFNLEGDLPPPSYWEFFHSENAKPQTNNLAMTSDSELDQLIEKYKETFDEKEKMQLSRKILQRVHDIGSFIPGFNVPFRRILYWRSWKYPKVPGTKLEGPGDDSLIWFDPQAAQELEEYQKAGKSFGESVTVDTTYR